MKTIAKAAALAAIISTAAAPVLAEDVCAALGTLAGGIMQQRQNGAAMSEMMARAASATDAPQPLLDLTRALIIGAFNQPQWGSPENKAEAVTKFRNQVELECYTAQ